MPLKTALEVGIVLLAFLTANSRESYKTHSNLPGIAAMQLAKIQNIHPICINLSNQSIMEIN